MESNLRVPRSNAGRPTASDAAIVVCTRDRAAMLANALDALRAAAGGAEIIVVDSASADAATREVAASAGVRYIRCDIPGLSIARNVGLSGTRRSIVVFTDDDCAVDPGFLAPLLAPFAEPAIVGATGRLQDIADHSLPPVPTVDVLRRVSSGLDAGHGALMAFRRAELLSAGGFDPLLGAGRRFGGAEDMDAFCRLLREGGKIARVAASVVMHLNTRDDHDYVALNENYGRGIGAMLAKWMRTHPVHGASLASVVFRRSAVRYLRRRHSARGRDGQRAYFRGIGAGIREGRQLPISGGNFVDRIPPTAVRVDDPSDSDSSGVVRAEGQPA
ncbi:glycosyltransferase family 2 protein [Microbacterium yannicii]|uniref:glycosyltransferase family 2 protein n=1 Tax=Microbacterium yannicii TaxID=671622 RepID=UPI0002E57A9C|nr:glycosyltransferase [Microbacterium yannicii]